MLRDRSGPCDEKRWGALCYADERVNVPRLRILYRAAVFVLLIQTGLDLSNTAFCSLDSQPLLPLASADATAARPDGSPSQPANAPHVDDCFCCSACIDVQAVSQPVTVVLVSPAASTLPSRHVPTLSRLLYHPPQLLS